MRGHIAILSKVKDAATDSAANLVAPENKKKSNSFKNFQSLPIQCKLTIGAVDDPLEDEAENMADKVMRMPEQNFIQRKCAHCEEEEKAQRKPLVSFIQKKEADSNTVVNNTISNQIQSTKGSGNKIPENTKSFMESRFGTDFSNVNIHVGNYASQLSNQLSAQAFTVGNDIYFNEGKYSPESDSGKHLLAHELTHTIQQSDAGINKKIIQKLGANPNCTAAETKTIQQAIFNARGWVNNARRHLNARPAEATVLQSLRRNFGPTYGVAANLDMITARINAVYNNLGTMPFSCAGGTNPEATCDTAPAPCGWAVAASRAATICRASTLSSADPVYQAGCVLHESFHATFLNFTVDEYSGWHGHSGSSATYPGTGVDPLLNADSYTSLVIDLS